MKKSTITTVERLSNGATVQVMSDGSKIPMQSETDWVRLNTMTEAEIEAAALSDPDNLPVDDEQLKRFKRVPNPKEIRQKLHLTQEQFAIKFHVPLGTLRDWEQGRRQPDAPARALLSVIAVDPVAVERMLAGN